MSDDKPTMPFWVRPVIVGLCTAVFLAAMGWDIDEGRWWVGAITLNILGN